MRSSVVSAFELTALGISIALWAATIAFPDSFALVPEYIAVGNALLLISASIISVVAVRQLWLWLRWWSIPIDTVLLGLALLPLGLLAEDLFWQLQPPPSEGFLYRGGFGICGTHVVSTSQDIESGETLYVLQQYCIPDGPEGRTTYVRSGASLFMRKLDSQSGGT